MKKINVIATSLILLACTFTGRANTHVWSGAQDGYWSHAGNWSSGGAPVAFEAAPVVLQFPSTPSARRFITNDIANFSATVIAFYGGDYELYNAADTIILYGQPPFPYVGNLMSGGNATNYIDCGVSLVLWTNITAFVGTNAMLQMGGSLSGPGGLTKAGSGNLEMCSEKNVIGGSEAANTYAGTTTILDGALELSRLTGCGWGPLCSVITIPGDLVVGDRTATHKPRVIVDYGGTTTNCDMTIYAGGTVELYGNATSRSLTLNGGEFIFMPRTNELNDVYYSQFECGAGVTSHATRLGNSAVKGFGDFTCHTTNNTQPIVFDVDGGSLYFEGTIHGYGPVHKIGNGELVFAGWDGHTGDWIVKSGTLAVTEQTSIYQDQNGHSLVVSNGTQLSVRGSAWLYVPMHLNGFGVSGTNGALVIEGNGGVLPSFLYLDSDTAIVVTNAADTFTIGTAYLATFTNMISGPGSLVKKGPGTLQLVGAQTNGMSSPLTVDQGTLTLNLTQNVAAISSPLIIGHNVADGTTATVRFLTDNQMPTNVLVIINDSGTLDLFGTHQTVGPLTLQGGDIKTYAGTLTLSTDVTATNGLGSIISGNLFLGTGKRTFHLAPGYSVNIQAMVGDNSGGFDLDGGGTLTLSGANVVGGPITVKTGLLYARHDYALGIGPGALTVASGARLAIDGRYLGYKPIILNGDGGGYGAISCAKTNFINGPVTLATDATINVVSPSDRLIFSGAVTGPGGLAKIGPGTLELTCNQANSYGGLTAVAEGTLELSKTNQIAVPTALVIGDDVSPAGSHIVHMSSANQVAASAPVTVMTSGVFDMNGFVNAAQTIGSLTGTGSVRLGISTLTVGMNNADTSFNGGFTGLASSSLVKQGTGTLSLWGASLSWIGSTIVGNGVLSVNGPQPQSAVIVNAGGTLAGNGTTGNVSANNGKVTPGNSPGLLNSGSLALNPASILEVELNGTNAGVSYDQVNVAGTVNLGGATLKPLLGFNSAVSNQFVIIANDGVEPITGTFNGLPEGSTLIAGSTIFQITYKGGDGNDVVLKQISAIAPPNITGVTPLGNGQIQLSGTGIGGLIYTVQANTNLATADWTVIGTVTADQNGALTFVDINAPNYMMRFYRFVAP
jgi:fibronectin-binding autotransporter adhesin